jgi:hypothetical protein
MPVFSITDPAVYATAVQEFLRSGGPVPVRLGERADLVDSVLLAEEVYGSADRAPAGCARGVLLGAEQLPDGLVALLRPLAARWLDEKELGPELFEPDGEDGSLLVAGVYDLLTLDPVRATVLAAHRAGVPLTLLTGRDADSLAWFTAKQYAVVDAGVTAAGLFTSVDRPAPVGEVTVFGERELERRDALAEILGTRWQRLLFQGHGKDDSINLADFTVCGLSEAAPRRDGTVGPSCAYGPTCYKPQDKLVQLRRVRAAEIVLSSCNSAPSVDAAIYDPKYQLLLNAVDGTAKEVTAAPTVHDSGRRENEAWLAAVQADAPSTPVLNASMDDIQPYPSFVQYGLTARTGEVAAGPRQSQDPLLLTVAARLGGYLGGGLLAQNHPLRPRLAKLAAKVDLAVARQAAPGALDTLRDDLQSLDHAVAQRLAEDPDDELGDYPGYFGDRSVLDLGTVGTVPCQCGRPAQRFLKRSLVPTALDTDCVVCVRCGDVSFRLPDSPELWIDAAETVPAGRTLEVTVRVRAPRRGPVRVGVFVPRYLQANCAVTPAHQRLKAAAGGEHQVSFTLALSAETSPQAYYLTAYAVQDLALSSARRHFGVGPEAA